MHCNAHFLLRQMTGSNTQLPKIQNLYIYIHIYVVNFFIGQKMGQGSTSDHLMLFCTL